MINIEKVAIINSKACTKTNLLFLRIECINVPTVIIAPPINIDSAKPNKPNVRIVIYTNYIPPNINALERFFFEIIYIDFII